MLKGRCKRRHAEGEMLRGSANKIGKAMGKPNTPWAPSGPERICRNTTLDCSKMCMYSIYVFYLCSPPMQSVYVFYLCSLSMQSIYVCIPSMKTRLQYQNFKILKIALNRVLTLPADRARCTDHFAGSGSKI